MIQIFAPTKILDSLILMQIVLKGPLHGYAVATEIEDKFGWKPSQTSIYNSLKAMENEKKITVEERIEHGRVQKIYSITEEGKEYFEKTTDMIKQHTRKNFSQFFAFTQMLADIENLEESEAYQQQINSILENMKKISTFIFMLLREAPSEAEQVVTNTLANVKKLAAKYNIQIQNDEN